MNAYRRPENKLESLLRWRRNVFLQLPGGGYVLVSATRYMLTLHHFSGSVRGEPSHTEHLDVIPGLFDGNGWNLALLNQLIQPEENMMPENNQQPYVALYCKPLRASISKMTDNESKVFMALATYADDQGICFPGVRVLSEDTGKSATEVSEALQGLSRKGFMRYLRHKAQDPITRKMQPDVYGLNPAIIQVKTDSGIQTYMHEFLNQIYGENLHNQTPRTNSSNQNQEPTPVTTTTTQLQDAHTREGEKHFEGERASASGKDSNALDKNLNLISPQHGEKPASQTQTKNPENDLPPRDAGSLEPYAVPLPAIDQEAYANEMRHLVSGLQLAKARQLVEVYGVEMCGIAVRLLAKQPFRSVANPPGWIINKLRQGALLPVDGQERTPADEYLNGPYRDFMANDYD